MRYNIFTAIGKKYQPVGQAGLEKARSIIAGGRKNMVAHNIVMESFREFIGREYFTKSYPQHHRKQYCTNPFVWTEADTKVKLGGLIEEKLMEMYKNKEYTLHSELEVYAHGLDKKADLSIHEISDQDGFSKKESFIKTLRAIIEIKYINLSKNENHIRKEISRDINKLSKETEIYLNNKVNTVAPEMIMVGVFEEPKKNLEENIIILEETINAAYSNIYLLTNIPKGNNIYQWRGNIEILKSADRKL